RGWLDYGDRDVHARQFPGVRAADDDGRGIGDQQVSLIYSMLMSVDGYVEDEHRRFAFAVPAPHFDRILLTGSLRWWALQSPLQSRHQYDSLRTPAAT